MILLTDGNQTSTDRIQKQTPLPVAVAPLKRLKAKVIAIGIGSVDKNQLLEIVDDEEDILLPTSFDDLLNYVKQTIAKSCRGKKRLVLGLVRLSLCQNMFVTNLHQYLIFRDVNYVSSS